MIAPRPPATHPDFAPALPDGRRRVGITVSNFGYGGIEMWARGLTRVIEEAGWQIAGIVAGTWDWTDPAVIDYFADRWPIGAGRADFGALSQACDLLICSGVPPAQQWLQGSPRTVLVAHGSCAWTRAAMAWGAKADVCVGVSQIAATTFPADASPVVVWNMPYASEPKLTRAEQRAAWGVPESVPVVGYLGRWSTEKRPELALAAARQLPPPWHFVAVGPYQDRVSASVRNGRTRLRFVGPTADPGSALAAIDHVVLPSATEGFALVACECWALGVPLIATPVGSVAERPDLVRCLPVAATSRDWAAAIQADYADVVGTADRVNRARAFAAEHLTFKRFAREWDAILRPLIERTVPHGQGNEVEAEAEAQAQGR
jgi:glycosyltransferase involved in cell wall biosynthesis